MVMSIAPRVADFEAVVTSGLPISSLGIIVRVGKFENAETMFSDDEALQEVRVMCDSKGCLGRHTAAPFGVLDHRHQSSTSVA